jgi:hypothetical protein
MGWFMFMRTSLAAICLCCCVPFGCTDPASRVGSAVPNSKVIYVDGAGGGGVVIGLGFGVRTGLEAAGLGDEFEEFVWHTHGGVAADQASSVAFKRGRARGLSRKVAAFTRRHPGRAVNLIGMSAGTAIVVFALESLPADVHVDTVVLLGSSVSADYDLTDALRRVDDRMFVFTSELDAVLGVVVPMSGTADREYCGHCSAGLRGFHVPDRADQDTRALYRKVENVPWTAEFVLSGNFGDHLGVVSPAFVRNHVAPLLTRERVGFTEVGVQTEGDEL